MKSLSALRARPYVMDAAAVPLLVALDQDDIVFREGESYELDPCTGLNVIVSDAVGDGLVNSLADH